jgi:hypothetical protein
MQHEPAAGNAGKPKSQPTHPNSVSRGGYGPAEPTSDLVVQTIATIGQTRAIPSAWGWLML